MVEELVGAEDGTEWRVQLGMKAKQSSCAGHLTRVEQNVYCLALSRRSLREEVAVDDKIGMLEGEGGLTAADLRLQQESWLCNKTGRLGPVSTLLAGLWWHSCIS